MNDVINRQPKGVPTGGQFATSAHGESPVTIGAAPAKTLVERTIERDQVRERMQRVQEQADNLDRIHQAHSVQTAGALVLARFPGATTLRIAENVDGENQYDVIAIHGTHEPMEDCDDCEYVVMEHVDNGDEWTFETTCEPGPDLNELVLALSPKDDRWAEGIATRSSDKYSGKQFDIDLVAARDSQIPHIEEEHSPHTRSLSADEQEALVEAAFHGIDELEDKLNERSMDYEPEDLRRIQERVDTLSRILGS